MRYLPYRAAFITLGTLYLEYCLLDREEAQYLPVVGWMRPIYTIRSSKEGAPPVRAHTPFYIGAARPLSTLIHIMYHPQYTLTVCPQLHIRVQQRQSFG